MGHFGRVAAVFTSVRPRHVIAVVVCLGLILTCAVGSRAQPRTPLAVYARVNLEGAINEYLAMNHLPNMFECTLPPGVSSSELHKYLRTTLYEGLLKNPAVDGIKLGVHWCLIEPFPPHCLQQGWNCKGFPNGYDWSYLDDVFRAVAENGGSKTVQLMITPGFNTPLWALGSDYPELNCTNIFPLIQGDPLGSLPNCTWVQFFTFPESQAADYPYLPLPWGSTYNTFWAGFLQDLGTRINEQPTYKAALVAIHVAGPVGASTEMILPTSNDAQILISNDRIGYFEDVDTAWGDLIQNSYPGSTSTYYSYPGQVFIDFWTTTIQTFENMFSGITLILTPDVGSELPPNLKIQDSPTQLAADCSTFNKQNPTSVSCTIKQQVLINFMQATGSNEKATNVGGLEANNSICLGNIGLPGVKLLTSMSQSTPILGGAEFDYPACSPTTRVALGCPKGETCTQLTPEAAAYNVLANFFSNTSTASDWPLNGEIQKCGARLTPPDPSPIHFIDIDYHDILYAAKYPCPSQCSTVPPYGKSMQDLLNDAHQDIPLAAQKLPPTGLPPSSCTMCTGMSQPACPLP